MTPPRSRTEAGASHRHRVRRARPEEADRLTEIALAAKAHWGYPEAWLHAWRTGLTLVDPGGQPIACCALVGDGAEIQLEHVWAEPAQIGRGGGRALVEHAASAARASGARALIIDSDPNAEALYVRLGAERIGAVRADVCGERRELPRLRYALA